MLTELCRFQRFGVACIVGLFVFTLVVEEAEARRGRRRGVGRQGGAARVQVRRGPRRGRPAARPVVRRGGGRGIQAAPSLAGNINNNVNDLQDLGPASRFAPDLFGGIGGLGNFGGFGGLGLGGLGGFGGINDPSALASAGFGGFGGLGDLRLINGFSNLAQDGRGNFFEVDPRQLALGRSVNQAVAQPLLGFNGKIVTGQNREVSADTLTQIRAFNQGEIPASTSQGSAGAVRASAGVVSLRNR